jgi:hypothetical protein
LGIRAKIVSWLGGRISSHNVFSIIYLWSSIYLEIIALGGVICLE